MQKNNEGRLREFTYDVYLCCYNAQDNIQRVIESIIYQTLPPRIICIYDDNSKDYTQAILALLEHEYDNIEIVYSNEEHDYDTNRLPVNINKMLQTKEGYLMIMSDDVVLPRHYVESLAKYLIENPSVGVISGNENLFNASASAPRGAGRIIDSYLFNSCLLNGKFPEDKTWESVLLFIAQYEGYETVCRNEIKYRHLRPNGELHNFRGYGQLMRDLGYSKLYVVGRIVVNAMSGAEFKRKSAVSVLLDYLVSRDRNVYPEGLKTFIRKKQNARIIKLLKTFIVSRLTIILYGGVLVLALSGINLK